MGRRRRSAREVDPTFSSDLGSRRGLRVENGRHVSSLRLRNTLCRLLTTVITQKWSKPQLASPSGASQGTMER